jgi:thioesterase domain-containing protein
VVTINRDGPRRTSFWGHTLLGDVSYGLTLSHHLGLPYPLFGLEQFTRDGDVRTFDTVEELADAHIRAMRRVRPHGPYTLGGYSLGGIAVYEMTRQLLRAGEEVRHLTLIDAIMPGTDAWHGIDTEAIEGEDFDVMSLVLIANALGRRWEAERPLSLDDIGGLDRERQLDAVAAYLVRHSPVDKSQTEVARLVRANHKVILGNNRALERYRPTPLPRPVNTLLFHATLGHVGPENPNGLPQVRQLCDDTSNGFAPFLGGRLEIVDVAADHFTICGGEHMGTIATNAQAAWEAAEH